MRTMRDGLIGSAVLHVAALLLLVLGLPEPKRTLEMEPSIPIDIVDIGAVTNTRIAEATPEPPRPPAFKPPPPPPPPAPPQPKPEPPPEAPPPPPPPEPPPPVPPPPVPPPPQPKPEPPPPPPPPPEPAPAPEPPKPKPPPPKPEPPKPEPPKPEPPKAEPPKPEPPKPEPPKAEPPKPAPSKPVPPKPEAPKAETKPKPEKAKPPENQTAFTDLLNNLSKQKPDKPSPSVSPSPSNAKPQSQAQASSNAPKVSDQLSMSEQDALRSQIGKFWNVDAGGRHGKDLIIDIKIQVNPDRTVREATVVDQARMRSDPAFRSAAESALRAVMRSSPLQLPADKYEQWRDITFTFNPRDMF